MAIQLYLPVSMPSPNQLNAKCIELAEEQLADMNGTDITFDFTHAVVGTVVSTNVDARGIMWATVRTKPVTLPNTGWVHGAGFALATQIHFHTLPTRTTDIVSHTDVKSVRLSLTYASIKTPPPSQKKTIKTGAA